MPKGLGEYTLINGCNHYFLHFPLESDIVILHIHGGPGQSTSDFAYLQEEYFNYSNFVYYDQRGAGRTQLKNKSTPDEITTEQLLDDLDKIVDFISERYHTKKIILLGHSWGSILGTLYIQKHPEKVIGYVGMGQVINIYRGEKRAYDRLGTMIKESDIKKYEKLRSAFSHNHFDVSRMGELRGLESKYGFMNSMGSFIQKYIKSPYFKWSDLYILFTAYKPNKNLINELNIYDAASVTNYKCPVFYLCGRLDWQVPTVLVQEYFETITAPQKGIYIIEDATHSSDIDKPKEFHKLLNEIVEIITNSK
jgi:proline iminopeptidase